MKCLKLDSTEGVSGLIYTNVDAPKTMLKEELYIQQTAVALDYEDIAFTYGKNNAYFNTEVAKQGGIIGLSGVGIVEKAGSAVKSSFPEGSRVCYGVNSVGAFCEKRIVHSTCATKAPDSLSDNQIAAVLRKGLIAHSLLFRVIALKKEQIVLIHDAASPLEQMMCRWGSSLGLKVIGVIKDKTQEDIAKKSGCELILTYQEDWSNMALAYSKKEGVAMVFDSIGKPVFDKSIDCLGLFGSYISYEFRSGSPVVPTLDKLASKSLFFTTPFLEHYKGNRMELWNCTELLFDNVKKKTLLPNFEAYKMSDAKAIMKKLEKNGATTSIVLLPNQ